MEVAWLHGLCGLCTKCRVPYEEDCVAVLMMMVVAVAVCKSTDTRAQAWRSWCSVLEAPSPPLHLACFENDSVNIHTLGLCVKGHRGQQPTGPGALKVLVPHLTQGSWEWPHSQPGSSSCLVLRVYSYHEPPN